MAHDTTMRTALLLAALVLATSTACAQGTDAELFQAFLTLVGEAEGDFEFDTMADRVPDGIPENLMPRGSTTLGGFVRRPTGSEDGTVSFAFARASEPSETVANRWTTGVPPGWTVTPWPEPMSDDGRGFFLCGPDAHGNAVLAPRPAGGTFFSASILSGPCAEGQVTPAEAETPRLPADRLLGVLPLFNAPGSAQLINPSNRRDTSEQVYSSIVAGATLEQVANHLNAQMEVTGWSRQFETVQDALTASLWTRSGNEPATAMITVRRGGKEGLVDVQVIATGPLGYTISQAEDSRE